MHPCWRMAATCGDGRWVVSARGTSEYRAVLACETHLAAARRWVSGAGEPVVELLGSGPVQAQLWPEEKRPPGGQAVKG